MKSFLALVAACVAITCAAAVNTAQAHYTASNPGNNSKMWKMYYHFTCNDQECGNWNVK